MLRVLDFVFGSPLACAFLAFPFLLVNGARFLAKRRRASPPSPVTGSPIKSVLFFVASSLLGIAAGIIATTFVQRASSRTWAAIRTCRTSIGSFPPSPASRRTTKIGRITTALFDRY